MERFQNRNEAPKVTFESLKVLLDSLSIKRPKLDGDTAIYEVDFDPSEIKWLKEVEASSSVEMTYEELPNGKFKITIEKID